MASQPQCTLWTFTGLHNVELGSDAEIDVGKGFFLSRPTPSLLSVRSKHDLSERQFHDAEALSCFLVLRESQRADRGPERDQSFERFQNGIMALQVLKPVETYGVTFQGSETGAATLSFERSYHRPPMNPGEWARMRTFDSQLISQVPPVIKRVQEVMNGTAAEPKNAIIFLQLALEHLHPLITGLLCVMGLEALFDSNSRWDFRDKLCDSLGPSSPAFPDWNSPTSKVPGYTVADIAVHLYTLRSTIAHGVDLRRAAHDKNSPVDLMTSVTLIPESDPRPYAVLLSEAAIYLLCQVLKKTI